MNLIITPNYRKVLIFTYNNAKFYTLPILYFTKNK